MENEKENERTIEGIEILNKTEIMSMPDVVAKWVLVLILGGIIGVAVFCCLTNISDNFGIGVVLSLIAFVAGIIVGIAGDDTEPTGRYQYEVTVEESVPSTEVYDNYDVVEQRGQIWILEDKEKISE